MDKNRGKRGLLSTITSKCSVYAVPIGNSPGWLKVVSLIVMNRNGSRSLRAANSLRYFTESFTELSDSKQPNSAVTGGNIPIIDEFYFGGVGNVAFICGEGVIGGVGVVFVGLVILDGWGSFVGIFQVRGGSHDRR